MKEKEWKKVAVRNRLEDMHKELVGSTLAPLTDVEMIVELLEYFVGKVDNLDRHSHTIS